MAEWDLAQRVKDFRRDKGMTQAEFAARLDISTAYVSQLETGVRLPSTTLLSKMARVFETSVGAILGGGATPQESEREARFERLLDASPEEEELEDLRVYFRSQVFSEEDRRELTSLLRWWCREHKKKR